jgi:shikimate dehydrogenase
VLRLGVLGWPVAHSRSPAMHNAALAHLGIAGRYQLLPVPPELFAETALALPGAGFAGANVTIPHKEAALALAHDRTPRARAIGAANTLRFDAGGAVHADNTDAPGLLAAIGAPVAGRTALVLGAGGSARAAAWALREAGCARVLVHNRTPERAARLARALGVEHVTGLPGADLLVNCTSVGLTTDVKELPLPADHLGEYATVVDLVPRPGGTALLAEAQARGVRTVDGLEVLVHQGALSFEAWTGRAAPLEVLRRAASHPHRDPAPAIHPARRA